jgi:hypothetical protein
VSLLATTLSRAEVVRLSGRGRKAMRVRAPPLPLHGRVSGYTPRPRHNLRPTAGRRRSITSHPRTGA